MVAIFGFSIRQLPRNGYSGLCNFFSWDVLFKIQVKTKILNFANVIFSEELRYIIYVNSELFLVHLKTDKSHTFIMYLVIFCVSLSLRELSELRGVRLLKRIFMKNLEWNPWNLKEPTRTSKTKITFICR